MFAPDSSNSAKKVRIILLTHSKGRSASEELTKSGGDIELMDTPALINSFLSFSRKNGTHS